MKINDIVIVGGGSAGWMTASFLVKNFPEKNICVIESPNIPIIGVGESTYDSLQYFIKYLDINYQDFFSYTDASIKLGIEFRNFYNNDKDDSFLYTFGKPYLLDTTWGLGDWQIKKALYPETPTSEFVESYFPSASLIKYHTFSENAEKLLDNFDYVLDTAFHFDATKFSSWLKDRYAMPRGVKHILSEVKDIKVNEDGIESLALENGKKIKADLFVDCTGFQSLLLGKTLKEPFISYNNELPNNKAWATQLQYIDKEKELKTVTTCTALKNGWAWNIPLWSRIGSGYVYSDKYISDEDALEEFKSYLCNLYDFPRKEKDLESLFFKNISMRVGIHEKTWVKNVVAIGLSAGFIEPLESNGLFTVHEFLYQLARALLRDDVGQWEIDVYNNITKEIYDAFVEFIKMHYFLSQRRDSQYWMDISKKKINLDGFNHSNEGAHQILQLKNQKTKFFNSFTKGGITWIAAGMQYFTLDKISVRLGEIENGMNYKEDLAIQFKKLDNKRQQWDLAAKNSETLFEYLKKKYYE
jgi:flavin-dependent dehydrogenase